MGPPVEPLDIDPPDMTNAARQFTQIAYDVDSTRSNLVPEIGGADVMMRDAALAYAVMVNKMKNNLDKLAGALGMIGSSAEYTGRVVEWADESSIVHDGHKRPYGLHQLGPD